MGGVRNMNIDQVLEQAPAKIAEYAEKENTSYAQMVKLHEEYKRVRAKKYLEAKALKSGTIPEIDAKLDTDSELIEIKDAELLAEITYRGWRVKKDKASNTFQSACEQGRNKRTELKALGDTIK